MASIHFFPEGIDFNLPYPRKTSKWIKGAINQEKKKIDSLNFIFCSDEYLHQMNIQYLNHKTLTDIITFNQSENLDILNGDIFISIDRVTDNASKFNTTFYMELHRVIIHGVLHLIGYNDKDEFSKKVMRKKEDAYLSLLIVPRGT